MRIAEEKRALRKSAGARMAGMTENARMAASAAIQKKVAELEEFSDCTGVFTYLSTGMEVATDRIVDKVWREQKTLYIPFFCKPAYKTALYEKGASLERGHFGIMEPVSRNAVVPDGFVLAVVPALALDYNCHRLGQGGGYYDRLLPEIEAKCSKLLKVGIVYDCNLFDQIPAGPHDVDLDVVLTENKSIRRRQCPPGFE